MATNYYVSKAGNDSNNGTSWALAKLTLSGVNALTISVGDTINIGAGTWSESNQLGVKSGVIYKGAGMFSTIISGNPKRGNLNYNFYDLKIVFSEAISNYSTPASGGSANFVRVWFDFNGQSQSSGSYWISTYNVNVILFQNCIFVGYQNGRRLLSNSGIAIYKIYNCIFYNVPDSERCVYFNDYPGGVGYVIVKNCIFHTVSLWYYIGGSLLDPAGSNNIHTNNYYYNMSGLNPASYLSTGEFISDPLFVNPASGDFRLQSSSPCIGKGTLTLP